MAKKRVGGRPTAYRRSYVEQARRICEHLGATDYDLALVFGVSRVTINTWKSQHPEFLAALKAGKAVWDERIEESFRTRAMGYEYASETVQATRERVKGRLTVTKEVVTSKVEHVPADTGAAFSWLKNRKPKQWREKAEGVLDININLSPEMSAMLAADTGHGKIINGEFVPAGEFAPALEKPKDAEDV